MLISFLPVSATHDRRRGSRAGKEMTRVSQSVFIQVAAEDEAFHRQSSVGLRW